MQSPYVLPVGYDISNIDSKIKGKVQDILSKRMDAQVYIIQEGKSTARKVYKLINTSEADEDSIVEYLEDLRLGKLHEHLLQITSSYYREYNCMILQMEYFPEGCLADVDVTKFFQECGYKHILLDICLGLHELHSFKLPHNNIKPSNILFCGKNRYILTDYCKNILYLKSDNLSIPTKETFEYFSPEIIKGNEPTIESDLWSYGCLLYYIYTGTTPFYSKIHFELLENIVAGSYKELNINNNESASKIVNDLLSLLLCINPDDRLNTSKIYKKIKEIVDTSTSSSSVTSSEKTSRCNSVSMSNPDVDQLLDSIISHSQRHPEKFLQLNDVSLTTENKEYFTNQLMSIPTLRHLQIARTNFGDEGFKMVCDRFTGISSLSLLMLTDDMISDEGVKYFCDKVTLLPRLSNLYLYGNNITDGGIECLVNHLTSMPRLEFLDFSKNKISDTSIVKRIKEKNPHIHCDYRSK